MNTIKTTSLFLCLFTLLSAAQSSWETEYASLLDKYVTKSGVKYKAWSKNTKDLEKLDQVVAGIAETTPTGSTEQKLAFYLNSYNAWMLKKVLTIYPVKKPISKDPDIFTRKDINVSGKTISLDHLENKIIRKKFTESRIHFALNCASVSCPPLHDQPFSGNDLNQTLHKLTKAFINSDNAAVIKNDRIKLNQIFKWFEKDFDKAAGSVRTYVRKYRKISNSPIEYLEYNWSLNEA